MERLWSETEADKPTGDPALVVDVAGFEGPLDLLLHLRATSASTFRASPSSARRPVSRVHRPGARPSGWNWPRVYLVMAAWLAFLKSKLLIPSQPGEDGESGEELASVLQFRLKRLEAMREAATRLFNRNRSDATSLPRQCLNL